MAQQRRRHKYIRSVIEQRGPLGRSESARVYTVLLEKRSEVETGGPSSRWSESCSLMRLVPVAYERRAIGQATRAVTNRETALNIVMNEIERDRWL